MAKRRRNKSNNYKVSNINQKRDTYNISNRDRLLLIEDLTKRRNYVKRDLTEIEDKRRWSPDPWVRRDIHGRKVRIESKPIETFQQRERFVFSPHKKAVVCIRRRSRRQVLFALQKTGKGSGAKRHRWNEDSYIDCRR